MTEHVIFVPEIEAFGGAERSVLALCHWLHGRGLPYRVLLYYDAIGLARYADFPLRATELAPKRNILSKLSSLRRYFASTPSGSKPLASGIQAALHMSAAGLSGFHTLMHDTPSLASDEGRLDTPKKWIRRRVSDSILGRGLRSGGKTFVNSEYLRAECRRLYGGDIVIARMGGMEQADGFRPRVVDTQLRILSVSRVEANKRIDWMLHSLAALERKANPLSKRVDWRLDVVGEGSLIESLRAESDRLGIGGRVLFHGFVSDHDLAQLYDNAHLFLMPARQGYGIPAVEALYRGMPVLVHRESGVSDILLDTPWCVIVEGGEDSMLPALEKSIDHLLSRKHLGVPLPKIPTEAEWAEHVTRLCGWAS